MRTPGPGLAGVGEQPPVGGVAAASSTAQPTLRWSAMLNERPPHVSRKLIDSTTSGRWRRIAAARSRRSGTPYSIEAVDVTLEELDRLDADDPRAGALLRLADARASRRAPCRRCRPHRASRAGRTPACRPRSTSRSRPPSRTRGRRGARRCRARSTSPRGTAPRSGRCRLGSALEHVRVAEDLAHTGPRSARAGACRSRGRTRPGPTRRRSARRARTPRGRRCLSRAIGSPPRWW